MLVSILSVAVIFAAFSALVGGCRQAIDSDIQNLAYSGFPRFDSTRRAAASFTSAQAYCAPFGIFRIVLPELPVNLLLAALRSSGPKKSSM